jgi:predicted permease
VNALVRRAAVLLTRVLLRLYPGSFRADVSRALLADVERRGRELSGWRQGTWLVRLTASLLFNALAAWGGSALRTAGWLDLKLAFRMLMKYPGLTLTGGLSMTVAVALGVGFFALLYPRYYPDIPLSEGDRLVGLQNWDIETSAVDRRSLYDFGIWRKEMASVEDLNAFRTVVRNATAEDGSVEVVEVAEITPSGFETARVPPLLGRGLGPTDTAPDASPVVVIGFEVWQNRFHSEPSVVGRDLRIGRTVHTIVGVMPEAFEFPVNHGYWTPLTADPGDVGPGEGPAVFISGRLAPGYDIDDAHAELTRIGERLASTSQETHERLRPEVLPYTYQFFGGNRNSADAFWPATALVSLLLLIVCVNVAILVYARTATRLGEIAVRTALGASRRRIVAQLAAESVVLAAVATGVGIVLVKIALDWAHRSVSAMGDGPFWATYEVNGNVVVYGALLAATAAVITGVVPALRATGRRSRAQLHLAGRDGGLRMGRVWTTLIVVQVAVASAGLPIAGALGWLQIRDSFMLPAFPADEIVFARAQVEPGQIASGARDPDMPGRPTPFATLRDELSRRIAAEAGVVSHAFTQDLPIQGRTRYVTMEDDESTRQRGSTPRVVRSRVDLEFFRTFEINVLAGRQFDARDGDAFDGVVVDRSFVDRVLDGREALGRRVAYLPQSADEPGQDTPRWHQIVGVVDDVERNPLRAGRVTPHVYHLLGDDVTGSGVAVRVAGTDPRALAARLPRIAAQIDPALRLQVVEVGQTYRALQTAVGTAAVALIVALASVVLLAAAGVYALMAFTVTRQRREIAIRAALGAQPRRLLGGIFGQAARQVALGVVIGITLALFVDIAAADDGGALGGQAAGLLSATVLLMSAVGMLAALGPARRGLRIEAVEALKDD